MKTKLTPAIAAVALAAAASPTLAQTDFYLAAREYTKPLPDGSTVTMWGYVEDTGGACYGTAPAAARLPCINALDDPTVPGPRLVVPPGETEVRIFLSNGLIEPTSIVIPGQTMPTPAGPTWNDDSTGARTSPDQRVRSFGAEAAAGGGTQTYLWTGFDASGTVLYHSGTHPQKQVYMGLSGLVTRDNAAGEAYPGVSYSSEVVLFYSDIDPPFNEAVAAGTLMTAIERHPTWFLVNGEPYQSVDPDGIPDNGDEIVTPAIDAGPAGEDVLLRMASTATDTHVAVLQGLNMAIHAEDGQQYNYQEGATVTPAPRLQYSAMLPPAKTKDATVVAPLAGDYAVYDGNGYMTNPSDPADELVGDTVGGMLRFLAFAPASTNLPPVLGPIRDQVVDEQSQLSFTATASDPDVGDTLTFSLDAGAPAGASIDPSAGTFSWTPSEAQGPGIVSVTVRVSDNGAPSLDDFETIAITVNEVNVAPVLAAIGNQSVDEETLLTFTATAIDADIPPNALTFSLDAGAPAGASIDPSTGTFSWTPSEPGTFGVTVRVSDNGVPSLDDFETIAITVNEVNVAPVVLYFSTVAAGVVPAPVSAPFDDADVYAVDSADVFSRLYDAAASIALGGLGLPGNADIDGISVNGTDIYVSFNRNAGTAVPGLGNVPDEDVVVYDTDGGTWSTYFDGSLCGLDASNGRDIDAVSVSGGTLYFSTVGGGNGNSVGGVAGPYDDADVYSWNGGTIGTANCDRELNATSGPGANIGLPGNADIDGLTVVGTTFYMSFNRNAGTAVPGLGNVQDEAVVSYDSGTGTWSVFRANAELNAADSQDVDAIHVP